MEGSFLGRLQDVLEDVQLTQVDLNGGFSTGVAHHRNRHLLVREDAVFEVYFETGRVVDFEGKLGLRPVHVEFQVAPYVSVVVFAIEVLVGRKGGEHGLEVQILRLLVFSGNDKASPLFVEKED